ncbi:MAG: hypothetical protein IT336_04545 [Thermomicrobiales bacterium]|nr:hypothetical protein [Thermomicrobiales bacterium]
MTKAAFTNRTRWLAPLVALAILLATLTAGHTASAFTTVPLTPTAPADAGGDDATNEVTVELPPPDLPTANEQGFTYDLRVSLKADLDAVVREAAVYELRRDAPTLEEVQQLVDRLEIGGEVTDRGDGTFEASGSGQLFVSTDLVQYFSPAEPGDGALPEDEQAIAFGREWLRTAGILPPDLGEGKVVSRIEETKRVIVLYGPAEPADVMAAYPSIAVTLGPDGVVVEASMRWANVVRTDVYQLTPARQAWQYVESGQAYIEADLARADLEPGSDVKGRATFNDISIAYATSGPPGGKQYLQPIFVFTGKMTVDDVDGSYVIRAYVPAIVNNNAPVGLVSGSVVG